MERKILLIASVVITALLFASFTYTNYAVALIVATAFITFMTAAVKYPNASIENSFLLSFGWLSINYFLDMTPWGDAHLMAASFLLYMLLIKLIYNPKKLEPIILLALITTIMRALVKITILGPTNHIFIENFFW